ncbi:ABC transporter permease [Clostridium sp. HV4-5-A1G]|uniref:ABC transporter permease n=1 Tax=Clostridium sp. HV4-5-A1G TaxID=2004595 RepID=UPI00123B57F4|nr:ABC transporter permease [Clostridium sp. HV4-5-A1G]KAA8679069.1 ABC transporter permease [Clostridium sp. HV4-5-A1G]
MQLSMERRILKPENILLQYSGYVMFVLLIVIFSVISPSFLEIHNVLNILNQSSVLGIVTSGMTIILIGGGTHVIKGGIDLSLGNNLAFNSVIITYFMSKSYSILSILSIAVLVSLCIGLINSFMIGKLKIIPLLATLSMMYFLQGAELLVSGNKPINISNGFLNFISRGSFLFLPNSVWVFVIVEIVLYIFLNKSVFGNWVNAVGGNPEAARIAGINVKLVLSSTYVIASIMALIASVLASARLSGSVPGTGDIMLFDILLAAYMSAIFSRTAVPNIPGTILSVLFVEVLTNGFTLINVPTYWVYAVKGALILLAVGVTTIRTRRLD